MQVAVRERRAKEGHCEDQEAMSSVVSLLEFVVHTGAIQVESPKLFWSCKAWSRKQKFLIAVDAWSQKIDVFLTWLLEGHGWDDCRQSCGSLHLPAAVTKLKVIQPLILLIATMSCAIACVTAPHISKSRNTWCNCAGCKSNRSTHQTFAYRMPTSCLILTESASGDSCDLWLASMGKQKAVANVEPKWNHKLQRIPKHFGIQIYREELLCWITSMAFFNKRQPAVLPLSVACSKSRSKALQQLWIAGLTRKSLTSAGQVFCLF